MKCDTTSEAIADAITHLLTDQVRYHSESCWALEAAERLGWPNLPSDLQTVLEESMQLQ